MVLFIFPAILTVISRSQDVHMPDYPLAVTIEFTHNHLLDSTSVLRRRDVSPEMEAKFTALMSAGYHPVAALNIHKYDLYLLHGAKDFTTFINDRHYCPDLGWCYRYVEIVCFLDVNYM